MSYHIKIYTFLLCSGCHWHGHCSSKSDCRWQLRKTMHPIKKPLTYEDLNLQTITRLRQLEETGRTVHSIWMCDIVQQMSTNPVLKSFMKDKQMLMKYKQPLDPASAVSFFYCFCETSNKTVSGLWWKSRSIQAKDGVDHGTNNAWIHHRICRFLFSVSILPMVLQLHNQCTSGCDHRALQTEPTDGQPD